MSRQREANFEVNLLPVISLLAVLISFLLVTAVWIHIGTLDVSQAVGPKTEESPTNPPSLQIRINQNNQVVLSVKDAPEWKGQNEFSVSSQGQEIDWAAFDRAVAHFMDKVPSLKTALVFPSAQFRYKDLIRMMDGMKKQGLPDIGISPL